MRAKGSRNPNARLNPGFKPGTSGNPKGRPAVGTSYAEKCREVSGGTSKARLAWIWAVVGGLRGVEELEKEFKDPIFAVRAKSLMSEATPRDRLWCLGRLEDRAHGLVKQEVEHSGEVSLPTTVVHEYHASS